MAAVEVRRMIAAVWLMRSGLVYSLQLSAGSFPKPLTAQEEQHYLERSAQGGWKPGSSRSGAYAF